MPDPISWSYVWPWFAAAMAGGYLLGSIPTGFLLIRFSAGGDIRQTGSGNIGATNVLRSGGRMLSVLTLLGDALKAFLAAAIGNYGFGPDIGITAGAGALLGHVFPVWLGFRGGKGAASYGGVLAGLSLPLALLYALIWGGILSLSKRASVASLTAALAMPFLAWFMREYQLAEACIFFSALLIFSHRENIIRLVKGEEPPSGTDKS